MKHNSRINTCIEQMSNSTELSSDCWLASFVHLQSFLARVDESYGAMQGSKGGIMLVMATRNTFQQQLQDMKVSIEKALVSWPVSTGIFFLYVPFLIFTDKDIVNAVLSGIQFLEMRLEDLSLQNDLWLESGPTSSVRITMLANLIQRSKDLIQGVNSLPDEEVAHITVATLSHLCFAVGTMATAVLTLVKLLAGQGLENSPSLTSRAEAQLIIDSADYVNLVLRLVQVLEARLNGVSDADREMDMVGSLCHGMKLLVRYFPYRVRAILGPDIPSTPYGSDRVSNTVAESQDLGGVTTPPVIPFINDGFDSTIFFDDLQWAAILDEFSDDTLPAMLMN